MPRTWRRSGDVGEFLRVLRGSHCWAGSSMKARREPGRDGVARAELRLLAAAIRGDAKYWGAQIELDQREYTMMGVMPKSMQYPSDSGCVSAARAYAEQLADRKRAQLPCDGTPPRRRHGEDRRRRRCAPLPITGRGISGDKCGIDLQG